ncbi:MgtC/SapB family protein [Bacillus alkalicellulosilyticus]|uniref:MgtC/SapB family protein n=1 Tax=Alkalihalobacterium alkalicellulosilyticum TaxID=1912214 RepID=UPI000996899B|nr:MgtC/SapB family protein [Bacillus alkalicellulosilyticus]
MNFELLLKLSIALLFGMLIGIDRELKHKPLGLKTCMVICVASCLVTIVSIESFYKFATPTYNAVDPMRLAAQIVSGVGFLGAGVILRRQNDVISGLTSAAMIWAASGLGIAVGAGFYVEAFIAVILLIISVNVLPFIIKAIGPTALRQNDVSVTIVIEANYQMIDLITEMEKLNSKGKRDLDLRITNIKALENGSQQLNVTISTTEKRYTTELYNFIRNIEYVRTVEIQQLSGF